MKNIIKFYIAFAVMIVAVLAYHGCSEVADNLVVAPSIGAHPAGWAEPSSPNFHGKYIFDNKAWNLTACITCHGADYAGGSTGASCLKCHTPPEGPTNCNLCHGNQSHIYPPAALNGDTSSTLFNIGAHDVHLNPDSSLRFSARVQCTECHRAVTSFNAPNHIGPSPDGVADITFDTLARKVLQGDTLTPNPSWDRSTAKCSNVYCHGYFRNGNRDTYQPVFNDPGSVVCGSCHGDPASGNPLPGYPNNVRPPHFLTITINECYLCHNAVMVSTGTIYNKSKHINGVVDRNIF